jgi:hypothetical protein
MQFETQFAQYCEDRGEAGEVHSAIPVWRRRGQLHGNVVSVKLLDVFVQIWAFWGARGVDLVVKARI